jgi:hypothetical protein
LQRTTTFVLACTVLAAAACGGDNNVTGPDSGACVKGQIANGSTASGRLGSTSCSFVDPVWLEDGAFYDAYTVRVTAGKAYEFTARNDNHQTDYDYVLELWGNGSNGDPSQLLAVSDDEGGGFFRHDPQMLFVAPKSGTYSLRMMAYSLDDTSTYTLTARECPVHGVITTSFSDANQALRTSDCVLSDPYFSGDSSRVALYSVHMDANTSRVITIVSSDFDPGFQIGGPGFDVRCSLDGCSSWSADAVDSVTATFFADSAGEYTLAVGSRAYTDTGTFKLMVEAAVPTPRVVSPIKASPRVVGIRKPKA